MNDVWLINLFIIKKETAAVGLVGKLFHITAWRVGGGFEGFERTPFEVR